MNEHYNDPSTNGKRLSISGMGPSENGRAPSTNGKRPSESPLAASRSGTRLSHNEKDAQALRQKMIGLGDQSVRKSYYPQLCQRIIELEEHKIRLEENGQELMQVLEALEEEQKKASENERKFQALFERISDGVLLFDQETRALVLGNQAILHMLRCSADELPGLTISDLLLAEDKEALDEDPNRRLEEGETRRVTDLAVLRSDGSIFYADINITRVELDGRDYLMSVFRDMTERREAETALETAYLETVLALARAVDARDAYTGNHSQDMALWAEIVACRMGCSMEEIRSIHWAAMLHDIGKIGVPDEILRKADPLLPEEWKVMMRHPETASAILGPIKRLKGVARVVRSHHERWDGDGYPDGLAGRAIPLGARIIAVVDSYGAITDERVYRRARSNQAAIDELLACAGKQFDPEVVRVFLKVLAEAG